MGVINKILGVFAIASAAVVPTLSFPAVQEDAKCTEGLAVTTAGYTINYAPVKPTGALAAAGYQPSAAWASQHVVATYTYGVPEPIETGFAYAQYKCQYKCNTAPGASFFVKYAGAHNQIGSYCSCYDELIAPESFVEGNETMIGAWNSLCR